jgi:uncharacterized ParB-like nuclease family protein
VLQRQIAPFAERAQGRAVAAVPLAAAGPEADRRTMPMLKKKVFPIASIYVPVKRRATLDPEKVERIAQSILDAGQETPIMVREDGDRLVLVEGLHRLEACRSLGEETILGFLVQPRRH